MRFDALANLRRKRRIFLQILAILFAVTGLVVTSEGRSTRFQMLPALPTEAVNRDISSTLMTMVRRGHTRRCRCRSR
jgi:hypothetical protein